MQVTTGESCYCISGMLIVMFLSCFPSRILCRYAHWSFFLNSCFDSFGLFIFGAELTGSPRSIYIFGVSLQPSKLFEGLFCSFERVCTLKKYVSTEQVRFLMISSIISLFSVGVVL